MFFNGNRNDNFMALDPEFANKQQKRPLISCKKCSEKFQDAYSMQAHISLLHENV